MRLQPLIEKLGDVLASCFLARVDPGLVRLIAPVVRQVVIHRGRFPDLENQKIHAVKVPLRTVAHGHDAAFVIPIGHGHDLPGRAIDDLPVFFTVMDLIDSVLLGRIPGEDVDLDRPLPCHLRCGKKVFLLVVLGVRAVPLLVGADQTERRIDLIAELGDRIRQDGSVRVADGVGPPAFGQVQHHVVHALLGRQGETEFFLGCGWFGHACLSGFQFVCFSNTERSHASSHWMTKL